MFQIHRIGRLKLIVSKSVTENRPSLNVSLLYIYISNFEEFPLNTSVSNFKFVFRLSYLKLYSITFILGAKYPTTE